MEDIQLTEEELSLRARPGEESAGNNLSFPVLLADGASLSTVTAETFLYAFEGPYTGLTEEEKADLEATGPWYAQKVDGNVWQAGFRYLSEETDNDVTFIDWGDAIEAVDPKVGRPYRLELSLYRQLDVSLHGHTMALLANPSSKDEIQGTNGTTYDGEYATINSPLGNMVVQRFGEGLSEEDWVWNEGGYWDYDDVNIFGPEAVTFAVELNVGGKYIFGASQKGWKPAETGNYRITFYLDGGEVNLKNALIGNYGGEIPNVAENNQPYVHGTYNLTYVDVEATGGGGGGGNGGKPGGGGGGGNPGGGGGGNPGGGHNSADANVTISWWKSIYGG